jgi:multiple sugar transport system permease protein
MRNRKAKWSTITLFILPSFVPICAFLIFPMMGTVYASFHNWDLLSPAKWAGISNFTTLIHDKTFYLSLKNTLAWSCFGCQQEI